MVIFICSCDKDEDTFEPFHHCIEKYWEKHPQIIYTTETKQNPYYKTINKNYPIEKWTKRIRETLQEIEDKEILLMMDDLFIRKPVDEERIEYARVILEHNKNRYDGNIALINFEKEYDDLNEDIGLNGFKKRKKGSPYELSIMCGLWNKEKLIDILSKDSDPWSVEEKQNTKGYDFLINSGDYIIDYGYKTWQHCGLKKGKWCREVVDFFKKEGIEIDYSIRGFYD